MPLFDGLFRFLRPRSGDEVVAGLGRRERVRSSMLEGEEEALPLGDCFADLRTLILLLRLDLNPGDVRGRRLLLAFEDEEEDLFLSASLPAAVRNLSSLF